VSIKRWAGLFKRPTGGAVGDGTSAASDTSVGLNASTMQPMRPVLLGKTSSGVPTSRADSLRQRLASSIGFRRAGASGQPGVGLPGSHPESGSEWRIPEPDDSGTSRRPNAPRLSWLPQKPVLAAAAAAVVLVAVVGSLAVNAPGRPRSGQTATQGQSDLPQASATAAVPPGDFNAVVPVPTDSAQPDPTPPSATAAPSRPPQSSDATGRPAAPVQPALSRIPLYSLRADVNADGPSGQRVSTVLGSTTFPDSTSMFVGCADKPATLAYRLDGAGVRLTAAAGLTGDATPGDLVARVTVTGDGRTLAEVTVSLDRQASIAANLTGVRLMVISTQRISGSCTLSGQPYGVLGNAQLLRKA
jgi:hypothetical protein